MKISQCYTYKYHLIVLLIAIGIRILFVNVTPLGQTVSHKIEGLNDEPSHYNYVLYLIHHKKFPVQTESVQSENALKHNAYEYYQPPLYYILCAVMQPLLGDNGVLYWGRFLSFVFGILFLIILVKIFEILKFERLMSLIGLIFASVQLSHVYFSSLLSNDSLSWLLSISILYFLFKLSDEINEGVDRVSLTDIMLLLLIVIGMYVKSSIAIFLPCYLFVIVVQFLRKKSWILLVQKSALLWLSVLLIAPWYIRNYLLYKSLFAFETGFGPPGNGSLSFFNIHTAVNATVKLFFFPMQHVPVLLVTKAINYIGIALLAINFVLMSRYLFGMIKTNLKYQITALVLLFSVISYIMLLTRWFNAEGRYLFTALGPIVIFLIPSMISQIKRSKLLYTIILTEIVYGYIYFFFT